MTLFSSWYKELLLTNSNCVAVVEKVYQNSYFTICLVTHSHASLHCHMYNMENKKLGPKSLLFAHTRLCVLYCWAIITNSTCTRNSTARNYLMYGYIATPCIESASYELLVAITLSFGHLTIHPTIKRSSVLHYT